MNLFVPAVSCDISTIDQTSYPAAAAAAADSLSSGQTITGTCSSGDGQQLFSNGADVIVVKCLTDGTNGVLSHDPSQCIGNVTYYALLVCKTKISSQPANIQFTAITSFIIRY